MTRGKFFTGLMAGIAGLIALPKRGISQIFSKTNYIGSRLEGELLPPYSDMTDEERIQEQWDRVAGYCKSVSGCDKNGFLNKGNKIDDGNNLMCSYGDSYLNGKLVRGHAHKGMIYHYKRTVKDGKYATEYIYFEPKHWGVVGDIGGYCEQWNDVENK